MKKIIILLVALVMGGYQWWTTSFNSGGQSTANFSSELSLDNGALIRAIKGHQTKVQVTGVGQVSRILADDTKGSRHQKFLLRLPSKQTILIAHNIDLAPRIAALKVGDSVTFAGQYEWNNKGGVVHWTHHDPQGRHVGGWLKHQSKTYQ